MNEIPEASFFRGGGMFSRGVVRLLLETIWQLVLLPGRVLLAVVFARRRKQQMRDLILGSAKAPHELETLGGD